MEARNRTIPEWFNRIRSGQIRLPRFQRYEAWSHNEINSLLETILHGLPTGITLILEVGDKEYFSSRPIKGAPETSERVTEHLLDGQQRLTALWRSLHDNYLDRTYYVYFEKDEETGSDKLKVMGIARWSNKNKRYPVWAESPKEVCERGFIPASLLRPGDMGESIGDWCDAAAKDSKQSRELERRIHNLREKIASYNIPFLALPSTTSRDVALDVFIKMNTSSVRLSIFDIIVAQVEDETGQSLHALVDKLRERVPNLDSYVSPTDLILSVAALREGKVPTQASYQRLDLKKLAMDWDIICNSIEKMIKFLVEEHIFDGSRLPTVAVLPVLASLQEHLPSALDQHGNARTVIRKYLWRAFFTRRYENSASTRSFQDFRGLLSIINSDNEIKDAPIFDEKLYPLPDLEEIIRAGWPKAKDILARGILAVSLRMGAYDLADGTTANQENITKREYHHLFPDSLLTNEGKLQSHESFRALNCALITWNTNRNISAKEPLKYLRERASKTALGEVEIIHRLSSHLIPYAELNVGEYEKIIDSNDRAKQIFNDYEKFLHARATMILLTVEKLCTGSNI